IPVENLTVASCRDRYRNSLGVRNFRRKHTMYRRLLTLLTGLALLAIPTFGVSTVAQSNPVPFEFVCSAAGRAHLSATNNADFEVRISVFSRTANSASLATSLTLGPGESGDTAVVPTTPPESGWS